MFSSPSFDDFIFSYVQGETPAVHSPPHSLEILEKHELEHSICKGFSSEQSLVANGKEKDYQRCRRDGKRWRCSQMVSPGNQFCEKHQLYVVARNERRRKGPPRGQSFSVDDPRCRRTGKGWRCHEMASLGKRYCDKHELDRGIYNAKRRKGPPRGQAFAVDDSQCRRTGKGWRCSETILPGKLYCVNHQLERTAHNERRRKRQREEDSLVASDHLTGLKRTKENDKDMETDQELPVKVRNTLSRDVALESSNQKKNAKKLTPKRGTMILSPCKKLHNGEASEGCCSPVRYPDINVHTRNVTESETLTYISPEGEEALKKKNDNSQNLTGEYSSASEELSNHPTPSFSGVSALSNIKEGERWGSSKNQLQGLEKNLAFHYPPHIIRSSVDKEEVGKDTAITLERTGWESQELLSPASAEDPILEASCKEITDITQTEHLSKQSCNIIEDVQTSSVLLEESFPTMMDIRISPDNLLASRSNMDITSREASMKCHEVQNPLCVAKGSKSVEAHIDPADQSNKPIADGISDRVNVLLESVIEINKTWQMVEMERQNKVSVIAAVGKSLHEIQEEILGAEREFNRVAAAPW
ncbi:hypothetical protein IFM89_010619 [Coptis chinensis]|uniref:Growth-regulating factor n=1 Tax=Coptis chinensis TaxID=261450 RepID=A0A835M549_9MAGN|nr:hypothetical protein IFM89_010619 [Coptis chinensis]